MARLLEKYKNEVAPALAKELDRKNPHSIPRIEKVIVSMGIGRATQDKKYLEPATKELALITGQKPVLCKARKSVSNFKLRKGQDVGLKVVLRRERMYEFLDRLISLAIPRVRDFRGLNPQSFDGQGNYSLGLSEQTVFPEVDPNKIEHQQGMNITVVTSAANDTEGRQLLSMMGMPFRS